MNFNAFLNNSIDIDEAVTCGKIHLHTKNWEISFICDFCHKNLPTLPDLLRHALTVHVDDVPPEKLQELCGIKTIEEVNLKTDDCDTFIEESLEDEVKKERLEEKEEKETSEDDDAECTKNNTKKESKDNENPEFGYYLTSFKFDEQAIDKVNDPWSVQFQFTEVKGNNEPVTPGKEAPYVGYIGPSANLMCGICYEKFTNSHLLSAHKKIHGKKPFLCQQCGATFTEKRNMKEHCFRHLGIKPFICKLCKKAFTSPTELKIHIRSHTGERPYKCSECDKAFTNSSRLTVHRRTHTNERPHLCSTCGRSFGNSTSLSLHLTTHSTERPHKCTECEANFTNRKGLRQHMQLHSNVKKYSCKYCEKTFAQRAGAYSHQKTVHKNELDV